MNNEQWIIHQVLTKLVQSEDRFNRDVNWIITGLERLLFKLWELEQEK
jgi:hypothetical protein